MFSYLLLLLLPTIISSFSIQKFIGSSFLGTSLLLSNIQPLPISHPIIRNQNEFSATKVSTERNNIYIYGQITPGSCEELKNQINELNFNGKLFKISYGSNPPPINIHIQSIGGSLLNALYIVDLIESCETPINTYIDGYAASAASLISVVGKERLMTKNSMIMIHQLSSAKEGKYEELDDEMHNLNQLMTKIKKIYSRHTIMPESFLDEILTHDLWLDAETCLQYGLIDKII
jgi:ATP-dependent Clp protease protease subunit